jgi:hypothetical protein
MVDVHEPDYKNYREYSFHLASYSSASSRSNRPISTKTKRRFMLRPRYAASAERDTGCSQ